MLHFVRVGEERATVALFLFYYFRNVVELRYYTSITVAFPEP